MNLIRKAFQQIFKVDNCIIVSFSFFGCWLLIHVLRNMLSQLPMLSLLAKATAGSSHSYLDGMGSIPDIPDAQNVPLLLCHSFPAYSDCCNQLEQPYYHSRASIWNSINLNDCYSSYICSHKSWATPFFVTAISEFVEVCSLN